MTYDKIQITNIIVVKGIAMPMLPDLTMADHAINIQDFNQWAKTQAIDAPGVPNKIYDKDELEELWQVYNRYEFEWTTVTFDEHGYKTYEEFQEYYLYNVHAITSTRRILRLKSPLLPDGQYSVMRAGEEKQIKTPQQVLDDTARKYNSEGFGEMLYWQDGNIERCVLLAIEDYAKQFLTPVQNLTP